MADEYIWFKNGKESKRTADEAGEKLTLVKLPNGVEIKYEYSVGGSIKAEEYYKNGERHRDGDKPAYIWYSDDGPIKNEKYFKNGKFHRDGDKPANIWYYDDGSIRSEKYYKNGVAYTPN